jgi:hypothetical protein
MKRFPILAMLIGCAVATPIPPPDPDPLLAVEVKAARGQGPSYRIAIEHGDVLRFTGDERTAAAGEHAKHISHDDVQELQKLLSDVRVGSLPRRSTCGDAGDLAYLFLGADRYVIEECGTSGPDEDKLLNKLDALAHKWIGYQR